MADFAALKKNRSKQMEKLSEQLAQANTKKSFTDPDEATYWKPTRDAAGNAFAILRFLPAPPDEDLPFITFYDHGFKGSTGQWYIENSLTTLGKDDPVGKYNGQLWNSTTDDDSPARKQARDQKRRKHFVSNILVIKDSGNPESEGKVYRYNYGQKIWGKLNDLMNPAFEDEKPVDPFDFWEGANFRLKVTGKGRDTSYDKSEFDSPSALFDGDEGKLEELWKKEYSLKDIIAPSKFKTYEELEAKLYRVLGLSGEGSTSTGNASAEDDLPADDMDMSKLSRETSAPVQKEAVKEEAPSVDEDEDDDLQFFKNLAKN